MTSGQSGPGPAAAAAPPPPDAASASPAASSSPGRGGPGALARWWPAGVAAAVMLALALWGLARDSAMGNDEVATRWAASLSLGQLAHLLRNVDAVHGAYYLLMHAWLAVGSSPTALRIPSVIAMTVAAALVAVAGRGLTGSALAGAVAGVITAVTPAMSYYAQTARSYALVFACVTGATLVLVRALRAEAAGSPAARRWWLGYALLIAVSGYLNELALLVLTAHAVTVLLARCGRPAATRWAAAGALGAVLAIPVVVVSSRETGAVTWITKPDKASLELLFHDYFGAAVIVAAALIICILAALLPPLPGEEAAPAWWRAGGVSVQSVALPVLVVPAVLLIGESLVARPFYVDRYLLYGEAGAALLAAAGSIRIGQWLRRLVAVPAWRRTLVIVPGIALCAGCLVLQAGAQRFDRTPASREFDFGSPSGYIGAHARPGDGVLYLGSFFRKASLGYPQDYAKLTDFGLARSPAGSGTFQGIDKPFRVLAPLMLRYQRIWTVGRAPLTARVSRGLIRSSGLALEKHFIRIARSDYRGVVVTLWVRK